MHPIQKVRPYFGMASLLCAALLAAVSPLSAQSTSGSQATTLSRATKPQSGGGGLDATLTSAIATAPNATDWPNNNYVRLLDLGDTTISSDGTVVGVYRETYKLFNKNARDLAEVNLPYNASYQSIQVVSARTIKKDGTVVPVKPDDIREATPFSEYLMYDDAKSIAFSMPAIEDNCIIDYTYKMVTRPLLMPGQFWTYWGFSGPEPVSISRYVLHVPASKPLRYKVYNDDSLKPVMVSSLDGKTKTYTWERKDIKPIPVEPYMPEFNDIRTWMEVTSLDSWQDIAHWFWTLEKPQAVASASIRSTVNNIISGKHTDEEKAQAIYDWVANRTRYVGLEFGLSAFKPHPAQDVHDKLYGDCKDKATLLITMLGLAGIKAHPVLLHAEARRVVDQGLPTLTAFNHCIALAELGTKEVWLDATAETCAFGDIPAGDRGVQALVVRDGVGAFETIPPYSGPDNGIDATTTIKLHADGSADADWQIHMRGAEGQAMRAVVSRLTPDKRKELMQRMASEFSTGGMLQDFQLPDGSDKTGPYNFTFTMAAPNYAKKTGSLLLLPIGGNDSVRKSNPYTSDKRVWPIVSESSALMKTQTVVTLPDGYVVEDSPDDVNLTSPLQEYHRTLTKTPEGKTLTIVETVLERTGKAPASDYNALKSYYSSVLKTADDQIVLKKAK